MLRAGKSLLIRECALLLRLIIEWMKTITEDSKPSLGQLVSWSSIIVDTHFIEFVLTKDYHQLMYELQNVTQQQMTLSEKIAELSGPLSVFEGKVSLPKKPDTEKQYTIEALIL
jgi:hypothetical protein